MTFCIYQLSLFETAMLKRFNMQYAVPPLPHSLPLLKATQFNRRCNQPEYTVHPRHDIAFAHSTLSQFNFDQTNMQAARHVLRFANTF